MRTCQPVTVNIVISPKILHLLRQCDVRFIIQLSTCFHRIPALDNSLDLNVIAIRIKIVFRCVKNWERTILIWAPTLFKLCRGMSGRHL